MDRLEEFLALLKGVTQKSENQWEAICPAHDDFVASLSVSRGDDGRVLLHCFAGCSHTAICHAAGKSVTWLFPDHGLPESYRSSRGGSRKSGKGRPKGHLVSTFDYHDEYGALLYQACRYEEPIEGKRKKTFTQRRPNGRGGWIYNMKGVRKVPYRLPELIRSNKIEPVHVVEGEAKADKLASWGLIATCNVGGASAPKRKKDGSTGDSKWLASYNQFLVGRDVVLFADNDDPGRNHTANVAENLKGVAKSIVVVDLPGLPPKGDVLDWEAAGGTATELKRLVASAILAPGPLPVVTPPSPPDSSAARAEDEAIAIALGLHVFGEDDTGKVKVFSEFHRKTEFIRDIDKLSFNRLVQLCGDRARQVVYQGADDSPLGMFKIRRIREALAMLAGFRRVTDTSELGVGVWEGRSDGVTRDSILLVGAGECAVLNGHAILQRELRPRYGSQLLELGSSDGWFDFDVLANQIGAYSDAWAATVVAELEVIFGRWYFGPHVQKVVPAILTGLVLATWVQTIWKWRPQVFILGKSNSGKTTLFELLGGNEEQSSLGLFGKLVFSSGDSTAAAITQSIGNSAKTVILDELEKSRHRDEILAMLRNSGRGSRVTRGTTQRKAVASALRHICWCASTESGLKREPDANRFIRVNLMIPPPAQMGKLAIPPEPHVVDLGMRSLAVAVRIAFTAKRLAERLTERRPPGYHYRVVESYSVPAAAYAAATGMTEDEAVRLLETFLETTDPSEIESDEERLLDAILDAIVDVVGGKKETIRQLIFGYDRSADNFTVLERYGLDVLSRPANAGVWIDNPNERGLFIACNAVQQSLLSRNDDWKGVRSKELLIRLEGAIEYRVVLSGKRLRGVLVPMRHVIDPREPADAIPQQTPEASSEFRLV